MNLKLFLTLAQMITRNLCNRPLHAGYRYGQLDRLVGPDHSVHLCERQFAQDRLHQDDRHLAHLQSLHPIPRGRASHLH